MNSGTDALRFALIAAGIGDGDIAITVPNTFIATAEAISQSGARPVFVDVDEATYNMDPEKLREYLEVGCDTDDASGHVIDRKLKKRVAAVVPVHLYGQTADMDAILEIAGRYNLIVIEDACQAHGAEYFSKKDNRWKKAGSMGLAAAFSFYPGKNLGACGEGGAVTTNDAVLAQKMRMLRDHGQARKYYHDIEGYNGRLDAIQAGILRVKLQHLAQWNQQRRRVCRVVLSPVSPTRQGYCNSRRTLLVALCLSPVRRSSPAEGGAPGAPGRERHRHRNPLSHSAAPAEGLQGPRATARVNFRWPKRPLRKFCLCQCTPSCSRISNRRLRKRSLNLRVVAVPRSSWKPEPHNRKAIPGLGGD